MAYVNNSRQMRNYYKIILMSGDTEACKKRKKRLCKAHDDGKAKSRKQNWNRKKLQQRAERVNLTVNHENQKCDNALSRYYLLRCAALLIFSSFYYSSWQNRLELVCICLHVLFFTRRNLLHSSHLILLLFSPVCSHIYTVQVKTTSYDFNTHIRFNIVI